MAGKKKTAAKAKATPRKPSQDLVAKKLRTGEIAVWDPSAKSVVLLGKPGKEQIATARIISGASFHALNDALGQVIVLV